MAEKCSKPEFRITSTPIAFFERTNRASRWSRKGVQKLCFERTDLEELQSSRNTEHFRRDRESIEIPSQVYDVERWFEFSYNDTTALCVCKALSKVQRDVYDFDMIGTRSCFKYIANIIMGNETDKHTTLKVKRHKHSSKTLLIERVTGRKEVNYSTQRGRWIARALTNDSGRVNSSTDKHETTDLYQLIDMEYTHGASTLKLCVCGEIDSVVKTTSSEALTPIEIKSSPKFLGEQLDDFLVGDYLWRDRRTLLWQVVASKFGEATGHGRRRHDIIESVEHEAESKMESDHYQEQQTIILILQRLTSYLRENIKDGKSIHLNAHMIKDIATKHAERPSPTPKVLGRFDLNI